jgi:hypothetical protein
LNAVVTVEFLLGERTRSNSFSGDSTLEQVDGDWLIVWGKQIERARGLLIGAVAVFMLLSVALYNGYPTLFSDTGAYLLTGTTFVAFPPVRAPGYSIFTRLTSLETSAWFTILAQALIVVYVLRETCDFFIEDDRKVADFFLLASVSALTLFTSLPWLASLLMPDVFAGVVFLSAFLLVFAGNLRLIQRILLAAILMISISAHMSLLPIAILFTVAAVALKFVVLKSEAGLAAKPVLVWLLVPIILSAVTTAALNRDMGLGFQVSPSRNDFILARLFGDGLAGDFLRQNCPSPQLAISCKYISTLPTTQDDFLFGGVMYRDLHQHPLEIDRIVRGTLLAYPMRFVASSTRETLRQLIAFRTGDEILTGGAWRWNYQAMQQVFPDEFSAFQNCKEIRGRLLPLANFAGTLDSKIFWLSALACMILAWTDRFERVNKLFYAAILFLVINAAICASLSGVYDRYQGRVVWLMPFCLTAYACCFVREWMQAGVREETACEQYQYDSPLPVDTGSAAGLEQISFTSEVREES